MTVPGSAIHAAHKIMAPLVEAAVPAADAAALTAREIYERVGVGRIGTVRLILSGIAREGRAVMTAESFRRTGTINRYRQTAPSEATR